MSTVPTRHPRIEPIDPAAASDAATDLLAQLGTTPPNVFLVLARNERFLQRFLPYGGYLVYRSGVGSRMRELAILSVAAHCRCPYEWDQHVPLARAVGVSDGQIRAIAEGVAVTVTPFPAEADRATLRAADELCENSTLSDHAWSGLAEHLDEGSMIEFIFLVGHFQGVAMFLNAAAVPADRGLGQPGLRLGR